MSHHRNLNWQTTILYFLLACLAFPLSQAQAAPGSFAFGAFSYSAKESVGLLPIKILRNDGSDGEVSVDFYTLPSSNAPASFSYQTNHVVFADGQTEATISVLITYDGLPDGYMIMAGLTNATGGTSFQPDPVPVTIQNAEPVFGFGSVTNAASFEGNSNILITVSIQVPSGVQVPDAAIEVVFEGISATPGLDYVDGSTILYRTNLTGTSKLQIPVSIIPDRLIEPDETFRIFLRPVDGFLGSVKTGASNVTVTIRANGLPGTVDYATMSASPFFTNYAYYASSAATMEDGDILLAGNFQNVRNQPKTSYLRLSPSFEIKSALLLTNNSFTDVRPTKDGKLLALTEVTDLGFRTRSVKIERFLGNGQLDPSFSNPTLLTNSGVGGIPRTFITFGLEELAGGALMVKAGVDSGMGGYVNGLAKLLADGNLDPNFKPFLSDASPQRIIDSGGMVSRPDASVWLNASLPSHDRSPAEPYHLHRISPLGFIDADFHPGWSGKLDQLTALPDGRVLGIGTVTNSDGTTWLNPILDPEGNVSGSAPWLDALHKLAAVQSDNKMLIIEGGNILRRFNPDGTEDSTFSPFNIKDYGLRSILQVAIVPHNKIMVFSFSTGGVPQKQITYVLFNDAMPGYCAVAPFESQVKEDSGTLKVRVIRRGGSTGAITSEIHSSVVEGQSNVRIEPLSTTVEFNDGEVGPKEISLPIVDNTTLDGDLKLQFTVTTLGSSNAPTASQSVVIRDNEYGKPDPAFVAIPDVLSTAVQADGRVVYATSTGVRRRERDGTPSQDFTPFQKPLTAPCVLAFDDEENIFLSAVVGGHNRIFKLSPIGTLIEKFSVEADNTIHSLLPISNGGLLVGGAFQTIQGQPRTALAQIFTSDGSLDSRFYCQLKPGSVVYDLQSTPELDVFYLAAGSLLWESGINTQISHGLAKILVPTGEPSAVPVLDGTTVNQVMVQRNNQIIVVGRSDVGSANTAFATNPIIRLRRVTTRFSGTTEAIDSSFQIPVGLVQTPQPGDRLAVQLSDNSIFVLATNSVGAGASTTLVKLNDSGIRDQTFIETQFEGLPHLAKAGDTAVHAGGLKFKLAGSFRRGDPIVERQPMLLNYGTSHRFNIKVINGNAPSEEECIIKSPRATQMRGLYSPSADLRFFFPAGHLSKVIDLDFQPKPTNGAVNAFLSSSFASQPTRTNGTPFSLYVTPWDLGANSPYAAAVNLDGPVLAMANGVNGTAYLGGAFTNWEGIPLGGLVRLRTEGSIDFTFRPNHSVPFKVTALLWVEGEGLYVAREFLAEGIGDAWQLARLSPDGLVDPAFAPVVANASINVLLRQWPGTITFGGDFTKVNGATSARFARVDSNGTLDQSLLVGEGPDGEVKALTLLSDGSVLLGGAFNNYQGAPSKGVAKAWPDGQRDKTFSVGAGFDGVVRALAVSFDGRIAVGGSFTNYDLTPQTNLLSFGTNWQVDGKFVAGTAPNLPVDQISTEADNAFLVLGDFYLLANGPYSVLGGFISDSQGNPPSSLAFRQAIQVYWQNFRYYNTIGSRTLAQPDQGRLLYSTTVSSSNPLSAVGYLANTHLQPALLDLSKPLDGNTITFTATSPTREGLAFDLQDNGQTVLSTTNLTASFNIPGSTAGPHYWRVLVRDGTSVVGASEYLIIPPAVALPEARWSSPLLLGDGTVKLDLTGDNSGTWIIERSGDLHDWTPIATNATSITLTLGDTNLFIRARK